MKAASRARVSVGLDAAQFLAIDEWRKRQPGEVTRPEAIRQLLTLAVQDRRQVPR